ncbi:hypothetical protein [Clostridium sp.]|uniref:hypothetical protein n=1 Tax=Clostridium sp. TaxID=1506 RepID=UPI0025C2524F|nr:hypothetical protein [Clostridium sp.]
MLTPQDFTAGKPPQMDSLMKVPGTWNDKKSGENLYLHSGVATYRLRHPWRHNKSSAG